jgi:hypothetical protein
MDPAELLELQWEHHSWRRGKGKETVRKKQKKPQEGAW